MNAKIFLAIRDSRKPEEFGVAGFETKRELESFKKLMSVPFEYLQVMEADEKEAIEHSGNILIVR